MLGHDDYFTFMDKTRSPYLRISTYEIKYSIIHPWMYFGTFYWRPEDYPYEDIYIYHNKFLISNNDDINIINNILELSEKYYYLENDETLYYNTGYWNIKYKNNSYIGISYDQFKKIFMELNIKYYTICFTNQEFILNISRIEKNNSQIFVDIYAHNDITPFIEIIEPFQKACFYMNGVLSKKELILEHNIRKIWSSNNTIKIKPVGFIMKGNYRMIPIIKNYFKNTKYIEINKLCHLYGTRSGGFINGDYNNIEFYAYIDIWDLDYTKLFNINFIPI